MRYYPTHGAPIENVHDYVRAYRAHRQLRESQILELLQAGPRTIPDMVATMYADVPANLHPAAARSVLAHLIHMVHDGRVATDTVADAQATYRAA